MKRAGAAWKRDPISICLASIMTLAMMVTLSILEDFALTHFHCTPRDALADLFSLSILSLGLLPVVAIVVSCGIGYAVGFARVLPYMALVLAAAIGLTVASSRFTGDFGMPYCLHSP